MSDRTPPTLTGDPRTDRALLKVVRILAEIARNPEPVTDPEDPSIAPKARRGRAAFAPRPTVEAAAGSDSPAAQAADAAPRPAVAPARTLGQNNSRRVVRP